MNSLFKEIFSTKKETKKIEKLGKILIDYREKQSLVPAQLKKLGFEIEFKELKIGDYIVKNFVIERKTISDFRNSMINKHLYKQIEELKQYENKLLIIEGYENEEIYPKNNTINPNAIRGFLLSIIVKHKIPIILSKNPNDTAKFISVLSKKKSSEISLKAKKRNLNKKEQMQFILESFAGIGPKNAKKLLEKFSTLQNIFSAPQEELKKIIGKKAEIFMLLEKEY
jgi:ERCC4-type nuclease